MQSYQGLARALVSARIFVTKSQASVDTVVCPKSFAALQHLPSHARVGFTDHRRGKLSRPLVQSELLMTSNMNFPMFCSVLLNFNLGSCGQRRHGATAVSV
ncbi:hypothetical protein BFN67_15140 [Pseudaminobacter manganicus]|uniref:Uncharacterized protein n=1 Tax=Manganibacter manganicus TaxID=1873176 RepID=A0A1V8RSW5_9HYPH|nr:hypothetical protein BFN67_15140 [Pseudaminobacter manganicus]